MLRVGELGFCSLGIACNLFGVTWHFEDKYYTDPDLQWWGALPPEVVEWLGVTGHRVTLDRDLSTHSDIAELNDAGYSFSQIADIIEIQVYRGFPLLDPAERSQLDCKSGP